MYRGKVPLARTVTVGLSGGLPVPLGVKGARVGIHFDFFDGSGEAINRVSTSCPI